MSRDTEEVREQLRRIWDEVQAKPLSECFQWVVDNMAKHKPADDND